MIPGHWTWVVCPRCEDQEPERKSCAYCLTDGGWFTVEYEDVPEGPEEPFPEPSGVLYERAPRKPGGEP